MIIEIILISVFISIVGIGVYKMLSGTFEDDTVEKINNQEFKKPDIFDNLPIFKFKSTSNIDQTFNLEEKTDKLDYHIKELEDQILEDNEKIEKFNLNYYNFYDRINNTTSNFNNSVDNIHENLNINKFNSLENDKKTIAEVYDYYTNKI